MDKKTKEIFDEYFEAFWERFSAKNESQKIDFRKKFERTFNTLMKVVDIDYALLYTFNVSFLIVNRYENRKLRKRKEHKYFLEVIDYYLKNENYTEYKACKKIADKYEIADFTNFKNSFRRWYKKPENRLYNYDYEDKISAYLRAKRERKRLGKIRFEMTSAKKLK